LAQLSAKLEIFADNTATAENNLYICRAKILNSAHYGTSKLANVVQNMDDG
jgi:hypothetical protein